MVEQPGKDRESSPDDVPDMQLPGTDTSPMTAPREQEVIRNDGDLSVGDPPDEEGGDG